MAGVHEWSGTDLLHFQHLMSSINEMKSRSPIAPNNAVHDTIACHKLHGHSEPHHIRFHIYRNFTSLNSIYYIITLARFLLHLPKIGRVIFPRGGTVCDILRAVDRCSFHFGRGVIEVVCWPR
jgi:hypothetical protein